jgi:MFS family permease
MLIFRAFTGIGLSVIVPTSQSLIADYFPAATRGKAYGLFGFTGVIGMIFGTLFATLLVSLYTTIWGIESWRFVFYLWGLISILIGLVVYFFAKDPPRGQMDIGSKQSAKYKMKPTDFKKIVTNKSFMLIVLQGIIGTIPWNGILMIVTWFEYVGFDPFTAGIAFAIIALGGALGNMFGGWIGDKFAKWRPNSGRIIVAQISTFSGITLIYIFFRVIPMAKSSFPLYVLVGAITAFMTLWCQYGVNNPLFSQLFEPEIRSSVFSVDRMFEGSLAAFGTLIVTAISTALFGFKDPGFGASISNLSLSLQQNNMQALANGIYYTALIPWIINFFLYGLVYFTLAKDLASIKKKLEDRANESDSINEIDDDSPKLDSEEMPDNENQIDNEKNS